VPVSKGTVRVNEYLLHISSCLETVSLNGIWLLHYFCNIPSSFSFISLRYSMISSSSRGENICQWTMNKTNKLCAKDMAMPENQKTFIY
jgi:hypothetical protein